MTVGRWLVLVVAAVSLIPLAPAGAQDLDATVVLSDDAFEVGQNVEVGGDGWTPGVIASGVICGNAGLDGSIDCDVARAKSNAIWPDGTLHLRLEVGVPPSPCPCIVRVTDGRRVDAVDAPVTIVGAPEAPPERKFRIGDEEPTLEVSGIEVSGHGPVGSWFGLVPERTLEVVVRNNGDEAVQGATFTARWGKGDNPDHIITAQDLETIEPGAEVTVLAQIEFEPLASGSYQVIGEVGAIGNRTSFEVSTSMWPIGLMIVAGLALLALLTLLVVRLVRWRRRKRQLAEDEAARADGLAAVSVGSSTAAALPPSRDAAIEAARAAGLAAALPGILAAKEPELLDLEDRLELAEAAGVAVVSDLDAEFSLTPDETAEAAEQVVGEIMAALDSPPEPAASQEDVTR